ncbi:MAG TPA: hypothetical protein DDW65_23140 [Firmicutes bacterium]|jgi:hypothetical protein|nr:hypothetical protein [Bacillota bacterium]
MNIMNRLETKFLTRPVLWSDTAILFYLASTKLLIHLLTSTGYGYFGDEFYWLAMAKHLDFGYVDVPPLVAYLAAISRSILGTSLFAIHLLPAIAGAVMVYFAGLTARELGGGRFAQWFSALTVLTAPYILYVCSVFTYDPFEQLATIIIFYLVIRIIINQETPTRTCARSWLLLGLAAGLGAMTKLIIIYTGGALVLSLLLTSRRKSFLTVWPWLAAVIAALICTPYLVWQSVHSWPLVAYFHHYALDSIRPHQQPLQFFISLFFFWLNPFFLPVWLSGLVYTLFHREGKKYRILGFTSLILVVFYTGLIKLEAREMVSACFPLLAAGAVWFEKMLTAAAAANRKGILWLKRVYIGVILVNAVLMAPMSLPLLPPPVLAQYWSATPNFIKRGDYEPGILPQHHRFSVGWPEIVEQVSSVYHSLPEVDRKNCMIWAGFYWDAGAINLLGKQYGLPEATSNCLSYQIWGEDQFKSGKAPAVAIMVDDFTPFPAYSYFEEVNPAKSFNANKYSVYRGGCLSIYICRKPKANFQKIWKKQVYYY